MTKKIPYHKRYKGASGKEHIKVLENHFLPQGKGGLGN
jgi:hypothetical protein